MRIFSFFFFFFFFETPLISLSLSSFRKNCPIPSVSKGDSKVKVLAVYWGAVGLAFGIPFIARAWALYPFSLFLSLSFY